MRRIIFDHLDIAYQSRPRVRAFDQVMAEQGVAREAPVQDPLDNIDLINPFARVDALSVEVLIGVGDCSGVNIEPSLPGIDGCKSGARGTLYAHTYTRLEDAVSCYDDVFLRVYDCCIQRMSQGSDHSLCRTTWELDRKSTRL